MACQAFIQHQRPPEQQVIQICRQGQPGVNMSDYHQQTYSITLCKALSYLTTLGVSEKAKVEQDGIGLEERLRHAPLSC